MSWLGDRMFLVRRAVSDLQRDVARIQWALAQVMVRLKELKTMPIVTDHGARGEVLAELWQIRDELAESDPDLAARVHRVWNKIVVARPDTPEGPDAAPSGGPPVAP